MVINPIIDSSILLGNISLPSTNPGLQLMVPPPVNSWATQLNSIKNKPVYLLYSNDNLK